MRTETEIFSNKTVRNFPRVGDDNAIEINFAHLHGMNAWTRQSAAIRAASWHES